MSEIRKGTIMGFSGSWGSGLGYLTIKTDKGSVINVAVENAPTVRSLEDAFGNVIAEGHTVNEKAIKGKEIFYSVADWGVMEGFTPAEEATPELIAEYEKSKKKIDEVI
jgi:hypothetical protein